MKYVHSSSETPYIYFTDTFKLTLFGGYVVFFKRYGHCFIPQFCSSEASSQSIIPSHTRWRMIHIPSPHSNLFPSHTNGSKVAILKYHHILGSFNMLTDRISFFRLHFSCNLYFYRIFHPIEGTWCLNVFHKNSIIIIMQQT